MCSSNLQRCHSLSRQRYPTTLPYMLIITVLIHISAFSILPPIADLLFESRTVDVSSTSDSTTYRHKVFTTFSMFIFIQVVHTFFLTVSHCFQMTLSQIFRDAVSGAGVNVSSLYTDKHYPVLHCERVETKYGQACV